MYSWVLERLDRAETAKYMKTHLAYAGCTDELFTSDAEDEICTHLGGKYPP